MTEKRQWFRVYADVVDDDKLGLLAFQDRWHFIAILAIKASGLLDADCDDSLKSRRIAYKLGITENEVEELARRLADVDLVDRKTLQPTGWNDRQFESDADNTAAERQRKHRAKVNTERVTDVSRVTHPLRHGRVTDVSRSPETETDTERASLPASAGKGSIAVAKDAQQSPESSPETASTQGDDNVQGGVPRNPCPAERIVDLYHAKLPMARRVEQLTPTRRAALRARWHNELPTLDAFGNYFDDVAASRFLTGRTESRGDRKPFVADFDWLLKPSNLVKVLEGKYHDG